MRKRRHEDSAAEAFGNYQNDYEGYRGYVDGVIAEAELYAYRAMPVFVGEFNAFAVPESWDYVFSQYAAHGWSWALWTYMSPRTCWRRWGERSGVDGLALWHRALLGYVRCADLRNVGSADGGIRWHAR